VSDELTGLDPQSEPLKLSSGLQVEVVPLRARQFFKFLRILTHGAMPNVAGDSSIFKLDPNADPGAFATRLLSLLALSVPDAENETIIFVRSMVQPVGLIEPARNKQDDARNDEKFRELDEELFNPDLDDLITIIEAIVRREAEDIQALGKRLSSLFKLAQKTGQLSSPKQTPPTGNSSAGSAEPSTFSPPSTAGPTKSARTSRSAASANA
jgi:hypothetical protein